MCEGLAFTEEKKMQEEENGMNPLHWRPPYLGYCYCSLKEIPLTKVYLWGVDVLRAQVAMEGFAEQLD